MLAIGALAVAFRGLHELLARDPAVLVGDLLHDRDGQSLVVPEFLRTLVFARPRGDDQFADCTFSPSLDMSR